MTKLKILNCDKTKQFKLWQNSKAQIGTKLKTQIVTKLRNSNCDKIQKVKLWQNSKNSNCDKSPKLKLWPNSKTQIVTKVNNSNGYKTQKVVIVTYFCKSRLTPQQPMRFLCLLGSFIILQSTQDNHQFYILVGILGTQPKTHGIAQHQIALFFLLLHFYLDKYFSKTLF